MCLIVLNDKLHEAEHDIICYKLLERDKDGNLCSIYYPFKWELGTTNYTVLYSLKVHEGLYKVYEGFHSFVSSDMPFLDCYRRILEKKIIVAECTIPKGSQFYLGKFAGYPSYTSNCLIVNKITYEDF